MAPKPLPKGDNTTGINPDGTPRLARQMKPLMEQAKRWQEAVCNAIAGSGRGRVGLR